MASHPVVVEMHALAPLPSRNSAGGAPPLHDQVLSLVRELRRSHLADAGAAAEIGRLQRAAAEECTRANIQATEARKATQAAEDVLAARASAHAHELNEIRRELSSAREDTKRLQEQSASTQQSLSAQLNTREDELAVALALADGLRDELRAETARREATDETVSSLQSMLDDFSAEAALFESQKQAIEERQATLEALLSEVANSEEQSSAGLAAYRTLLDQSGTRISELSQECAELTSQQMSQCDDGAAGGALRSPHHHDESDQQQSQNIVLTELSEEVKRLRVKLVSLQGEYDSAADGERIAREQAASDATAAASRLRDALATAQACRDDSTALREALRASEDRLVTANAHADEIAARLQCAEGEIVRLANELQEVTDTALSKGAEASHESENAAVFKKNAEMAAMQSYVLTERVKDLQTRLDEAAARATASAVDGESARLALATVNEQCEKALRRVRELEEAAASEDTWRLEIEKVTQDKDESERHEKELIRALSREKTRRLALETQVKDLKKKHDLVDNDLALASRKITALKERCAHLERSAATPAASHPPPTLPRRRRGSKEDNSSQRRGGSTQGKHSRLPSFPSRTGGGAINKSPLSLSSNSARKKSRSRKRRHDVLQRKSAHTDDDDDDTEPSAPNVFAFDEDDGVSVSVSSASRPLHAPRVGVSKRVSALPSSSSPSLTTTTEPTGDVDVNMSVVGDIHKPVSNMNDSQERATLAAAAKAFFIKSPPPTNDDGNMFITPGPLPRSDDDNPSEPNVRNGRGFQRLPTSPSNPAPFKRSRPNINTHRAGDHSRSREEVQRQTKSSTRDWGSEQGESTASGAPTDIADARPVLDDVRALQIDAVPVEDDEEREVETIVASSPTFKPVRSNEGVIPVHCTIASPVSAIADDDTAAPAVCDDVEYDESVRVHAQVTGDIVRPLRPRPSRQSLSPVAATSAADDDGESVSEADTRVVDMSPRSRPVRAAAKKKVNYVDASYDDDLDDVDDNDVEGDGDDGESHYAKESTEPDEMVVELDEEELTEGGDEEDQVDDDQEDEAEDDDDVGDEDTTEGALEPPIPSRGNSNDDGRGGPIARPPPRGSSAGGANGDRRTTPAASSSAPAARREHAPYEFDFSQFFQEHEELDTIAGLNLPRAARARPEP